MVEVGNNLDPDEEFDFLQNILDFPMDCLEEDEGLEDWDLNNPQCLGPIPSDVLMGTSMISDEIFNSKSPSLFPRPIAPVPPERKFAKVQESASFCTQSPVSILESSGSYSREKSLPVKSDNAIGSINPSLLAARDISTSIQTSNARRSKGSRKRIFQQPAAMDLGESSFRSVDSSLGGSDLAHLQNTSKPCLLVKKCAHCETTKTTRWRWGPLGQNTLCNACGVRFRSGRLFPEYRPAASPKFVPSQHSNSHGKVEEIRKNADRLSLKIKIKIVRAPEQMHLAEQVDTSCSLLPQQIVGAPEQEKLTKHIDTSSSHKSPQIAGVVKQKQLKKHAVSLVPPQVARVPEHKQQLADHVNTSISEKSSSIMSARLKRSEPAGEITQLFASPSTCRKTSNARAGKECRKKSCHLPVAMDVSENDDDSSAMTDPARLQNAFKLRPEVFKKCAHCQSTKTPQWRSGPLGHNTLCNACGLRIRFGCLLPEYRPAASPTFVPSQHTNRQSKVVKMRVNATRIASAESKQDIIYISDSDSEATS